MQRPQTVMVHNSLSPNYKKLQEDEEDASRKIHSWIMYPISYLDIEFWGEKVIKEMWRSAFIAHL